jgi:nicotinamide riboside transporter PnuC
LILVHPERFERVLGGDGDAIRITLHQQWIGFMTWIEGIAALCGLLCVWLTIRQSVLCWPTGLVQVVLYIGVFYEARLYSDLILHVIYVIMQVYGWHHWLHGGCEENTTSPFFQSHRRAPPCLLFLIERW